jgi:hypothetical protein
MRIYGRSVVLAHRRHVAVGTIAIGICSLAAWRAPSPPAVGCSSGSTSIAPCSGSADTLIASAAGQRTFAVLNSGPSAITYTPSCEVTASVASCTTDQATITVPADSTGSVTVFYAAGSTSADGTVILALDGGGDDLVATVITISTRSASGE